MDCGEVGCCQAVVARCDTAEVFQPAEHAFDRIAASVEHGTEAGLPAAVCLRRDIRHGTACLDRTAEAISIEGTIGDHQGTFGNGLDQRFAAAEVGRVAAGEEEGDRLAALVGRRMDLGGAATAGAPDRLRVLPPLAPEALRCALA